LLIEEGKALNNHLEKIGPMFATIVKASTQKLQNDLLGFNL